MTNIVFLKDAITFDDTAEAWAKTKGLLSPTGELVPPELTAGDITHNGQTMAALIDKALYTPAVISGLTATPSVIEQGASVSVALAWTITGSITAQTINGATVPYADRSKTYTSVSVNTTYQLAITDSAAPGGAVGSNASVSVAVRPRRYWGLSANTTLTSSEIIALSNSELNSTRAKSFIIDGGVSPGSYVYYAYLASLGDPTNYKIFGFDDVPVKSTVTVTTAVGAVLNYTVLRSENKLFGSISVDVV